MNTNTENNPAGVDFTRWMAVGSLLGLVLLGLAWELWLAPLRPGGSWWAIKVLPLCVPLAGIQTLLCITLFVACALHVRIRFKAAKATGNFVPVPRD